MASLLWCENRTHDKVEISHWNSRIVEYLKRHQSKIFRIFRKWRKIRSWWHFVSSWLVKNLDLRNFQKVIAATVLGWLLCRKKLNYRTKSFFFKFLKDSRDISSKFYDIWIPRESQKTYDKWNKTEWIWIFDREKKTIQVQWNQYFAILI